MFITNPKFELFKEMGNVLLAGDDLCNNMVFRKSLYLNGVIKRIGYTYYGLIFDGSYIRQFYLINNSNDFVMKVLKGEMGIFLHNDNSIKLFSSGYSIEDYPIVTQETVSVSDTPKLFHVITNKY